MSGQEKRYQLVHPISVSTKSTVYYGTLSGFGSFKKDIAISSKFNKLPKFDLIIHCAAEPAIEASRKKMEEVFG